LTNCISSLKEWEIRLLSREITSNPLETPLLASNQRQVAPIRALLAIERMEWELKQMILKKKN